MITIVLFCSINHYYYSKVRPDDELSGKSDPYALPKKLKMIKVVDSGSDLTVFDIEDRIFKQRERFEVKFAKKKAAEDEYYSNKYNNPMESNEEEVEEEATTTTTMKPKKTAAGKKANKKAVVELSPPVEEKKVGRPKRNARKVNVD